MRTALATVMVLALLWACAEPTQETPETTLGSGIKLDYLDEAVTPQEDFYQFVNGGWHAQAEIPADRSRWGSFDELRERTEEQVLTLIQQAAEEDAAAGSAGQKVGDAYLSYLDREQISERGLAPLRTALASIDDLDSSEALHALWGDSFRRMNSSPLSLHISPDPGDSDRYIVHVNQSGLGLPDRDFYLRDDSRFADIRQAYRDYIERVHELAGLDAGADAADAVLAIETALAEVHWDRVRNRDRRATYNLLPRDELEKLAPELEWQAFLTAAELDDLQELNLRQPDMLEALHAALEDFDMSAWRHYHRFHLLRQASPWLDDDFVEAHFDFFGRTLDGQPEMRPLEERAMRLTERLLGFKVGRLYVDAHYPEEARERMETMVGHLLDAYQQRLQELDWMTADTREEALHKLARFHTKIGHPDKDAWRDYDCLQIDVTDLLGNLRRSAVCEHERQLERLDQPVDRDEWFMTPQTVNAYYSPPLNEIVFPAAILQPPFFDVEADPAVNYGAIGAVIGHELSHGFDDQGRRVDGDGNLRDWWTEEDEERFMERAERLVAQYAEFEPLPDTPINGELTLGENIADLGGLRMAFRAWQRSLEGDAPAEIDGFTGEQRFFMGWAQVWRTLYRDEALQRHLMTAPHSPGRYRVIGVAKNMDEFHQAFDVQEGDPMYRPAAERVEIW